MNITAKKGDILTQDVDIRIVGIYEGENWENDFILRLGEETGGKLKVNAKKKEFEGKAGQMLNFSDLLIVGLGKQTNLSASLREVSGSIYGFLQGLPVTSVAIELFGEDDVKFDAKITGQKIAEALLLASYQFDTYKKPKQKNILEEIYLIAEDGRDANKAQKGIEKAEMLIDGVTVARDLVNTPAQDMKPTRLAQTAEKIAKMSPNIKVRVYNREQIEKKKMNAYLAVAQGADSEPRLIHLTYKPEKAKKIVAVVGKGVTFDSGGLSIKPAQYMETMKCDMAGSAAVLGLFAALARTNPNIEVHGIIAATENMPSGKAIRPGDIVRAANDKTIEILNTDAEGRLTLADALVYAQKQKPDYVVDLATLTGACVVALGEEISAVMGNDSDLSKSLMAAAEKSDEQMWEMPLYGKYAKLIESDIADLRNISSSRYGGTLTAGLFLKEFINEDQKWAHIDIAGPAFAEKPMASYLGKGGTGFGVRTLLGWIETL
ncbi:leucyl aminopeptidase [Candidatus Uhrbacteria bacterium]|nr:leucyl aminopeptidase [Candidatus Uhrbacteria bacterium]MBT7717474.1 leucyl aminopeptidase [Candidatus Uhrbacteria bacterium]